MKVEYKKSPSEYELKNIIWVGIDYNKKKLLKFYKEYNFLKSLSDDEESEELIRIMDEIILSYGQENLDRLLNNDPEYSRWATIELISKEASLDLMIDGRYSKKTFYKMSHLPVVDFKLTLKRIQEMVKNVDRIVKDTDLGNSNIPGVK